MRVNKINIFIIIGIVLLISVIIPIEYVNSAFQSDYTLTSSNQCSNPTKVLNIQGEAPDHYNVTSFSVAPGTCLAVSFRNVDTIYHSFTIDTNSAYNVSYFTIYTAPGQTKTVNFQAPNVNVAIKYYCAIPGHEANGMYGTLTVGSNPSTGATPSTFFLLLVPGFIIIIISILILVSIIAIFHRSDRNKSDQISSNITYFQSSFDPHSAYNNSHLCSNCHEKVLFDDVFCPNCGQRL